jgi:hypothetical protein
MANRQQVYQYACGKKQKKVSPVLLSADEMQPEDENPKRMYTRYTQLKKGSSVSTES